MADKVQSQNVSKTYTHSRTFTLILFLTSEGRIKNSYFHYGYVKCTKSVVNYCNMRITTKKSAQNRVFNGLRSIGGVDFEPHSIRFWSVISDHDSIINLINQNPVKGTISLQ